MKKVAIIGYGYVGQAVEKFFKNHFDIVVYDPKYYPLDCGISIDDWIIKTKKLVNDCHLAVVSVPTPMAEDHSVDLSIIKETISWLETPLILIKSTIPPGTTKSLIEEFDKNICFSPEYIGEGNYEIPYWKGYPDPTNMKHHNFQIIGGSKHTASQIVEFFQKVTGPDPVYRITDSTTAELCKYMENAYIATKVTFCNEFAKIAETFGVEYVELRDLWLLDQRIGRMFTSVFSDKRGFGGKCLPKDVNGIVERSKESGYTPKLLEAVLSVNEEIKTNQS